MCRSLTRAALGVVSAGEARAQAIGKWWLLYEFNSETMSDKQACIDAYLAHNEHIKATVPPERLLIWQAKDGWAPLCKCVSPGHHDTCVLLAPNLAGRGRLGTAVQVRFTAIRSWTACTR